MPLFFIHKPLEVADVVEAMNEAKVPRVEVPKFRTENRPLVELSAVELEVTSKIVPLVKLLAFKL